MLKSLRCRIRVCNIRGLHTYTTFSTYLVQVMNSKLLTPAIFSPSPRQWERTIFRESPDLNSGLSILTGMKSISFNLLPVELDLFKQRIFIMYSNYFYDVF